MQCVGAQLVLSGVDYPAGIRWSGCGTYLFGCLAGVKHVADMVTGVNPHGVAEGREERAVRGEVIQIALVIGMCRRRSSDERGSDSERDTDRPGAGLLTRISFVSASCRTFRS